MGPDREDLRACPDHLIVVGGGPIGLEMAQAHRRLGARVTVLEALEVLGPDDRELAAVVRARLVKEGVEIHEGTAVQKVEQTEQGVTAIVERDGAEHRVTGSHVLVATGRRPNIDSLDLDAAGIEHSRKGIEVDPRLRTSNKRIFAIGDVAGGYQFTHVAGYHAGIVIRNALFKLPAKVNYRAVPWVTYTDPELANIGMNETMATAKGIEYRVYTEEFRNNDRSLAEEERIGKVKLLLDEKEKPIGVQIFGPQAGILLSEWVAALNGKVKLSTIASAIHPYPTIGEINKKVVGNFFSPKIFSDKVKKGLKFFFSLKGRACEVDECS